MTVFDSNRTKIFKVSNRVCVALSRAKNGLYVIGNFDFLAENCQMWDNIHKSVVSADAISNGLVVKCQKHGNEQASCLCKPFLNRRRIFQLMLNGNDIETKCREGGCSIPCSNRLNCGHTCPKPCHAEDMEHEFVKCLKPCERVCDSAYKHPCSRNCWEECRKCQVLVQKSLSCGHQKNDYCYLALNEVVCVEPCEKLLPCGHLCDQKCGSKCTANCKTIVRRQLPQCKHWAEIECHLDPARVKCQEVIEKTWARCSHTVVTKCCVDTNVAPCEKKCEALLPDCGHLCQGTCGQCNNGKLNASVN